MSTCICGAIHQLRSGSARMTIQMMRIYFWIAVVIIKVVRKKGMLQRH